MAESIFGIGQFSCLLFRFLEIIFPGNYAFADFAFSIFPCISSNLAAFMCCFLAFIITLWFFSSSEGSPTLKGGASLSVLHWMTYIDGWYGHQWCSGMPNGILRIGSPLTELFIAFHPQTWRLRHSGETCSVIHVKMRLCLICLKSLAFSYVWQ